MTTLPTPSDTSNVALPDQGINASDEDIVPDHYYGGGKIPVFKPTMDQFRSFKEFMSKIDKYGMKSGIVKVIPPKEWRDALPPLDEAAKTIRVKNPIAQEIAGSQGTYRQTNIEKQRSYSLPQWRQLCEGSEHQPPARRGERRTNQPTASKQRPSPRMKTEAGSEAATTTTSAAAAKSTKRGAGKGRARGKKGRKATEPVEDAVPAHDTLVAPDASSSKPMGPPTPVSHASPEGIALEHEPSTALVDMDQIRFTPTNKEDEGEPAEAEGDDEEFTPRKAKGRQPKSVSSRRKHNRRTAAEVIDEAAFVGFDYRIHNHDEYTPERCEELERHYWKTLTYNSPLYGADMPGSLFDDSTTEWNVAKLENLLDVLGQKVPGVNTAYLYLGMWKSTFAWHLEDVDLYSINYIHFGAPKQWYSISQEDARRFEQAMKSIWPADAKHCSQFLRHKTYLISPTLLQSQFNIRVNRLVHHEGEFVITFPYGYHSGYNLGYNCAESVNFATESWLQYGKIAKKCNCTEDSVWVDVYDIERKLQGPLLIEADESEGEGTVDSSMQPLTPPASIRDVQPTRNRGGKAVDKPSASPGSGSKKLRVRLKVSKPSDKAEPCVLCPNDLPWETLLPTDDGRQAHRLCALYTPETFIRTGDDEIATVCNVQHIDPARLALSCKFCRSKRGACFQCSHGKCVRAYHATCAAAAGVLVDLHDVLVVGDDGVSRTEVGFRFLCDIHRPKRLKTLDADSLGDNEMIYRFARQLRPGEVIQMQYLHRGIFGGVVVENRRREQSVMVDVLPQGDRVEVDYKWILVHDLGDLHRLTPTKQSPNNSPVPEFSLRPTAPFSHISISLDPDLQPVNSEILEFVRSPQPEHHQFQDHDDQRADSLSPGSRWKKLYCWDDIQEDHVSSSEQQALDESQPTRWAFYLPEASTGEEAQYTADPASQQPNPFLVPPQVTEMERPGPNQRSGGGGRRRGQSGAHQSSNPQHDQFMGTTSVQPSVIRPQHAGFAQEQPDVVDGQLSPVPYPPPDVQDPTRYYLDRLRHLTHNLPLPPNGRCRCPQCETGWFWAMYHGHEPPPSHSAEIWVPPDATELPGPSSMTPKPAPARVRSTVQPSHDGFPMAPAPNTPQGHPMVAAQTPHQAVSIPHPQTPSRPHMDPSHIIGNQAPEHPMNATSSSGPIGSSSATGSGHPHQSSKRVNPRDPWAAGESERGEPSSKRRAVSSSNHGQASSTTHRQGHPFQEQTQPQQELLQDLPGVAASARGMIPRQSQQHTSSPPARQPQAPRSIVQTHGSFNAQVSQAAVPRQDFRTGDSMEGVSRLESQSPQTSFINRSHDIVDQVARPSTNEQAPSQPSLTQHVSMAPQPSHVKVVSNLSSQPNPVVQSQGLVQPAPVPQSSVMVQSQGLVQPAPVPQSSVMVQSQDLVLPAPLAPSTPSARSNRTAAQLNPVTPSNQIVQAEGDVQLPSDSVWRFLTFGSSSPVEPGRRASVSRGLQPVNQDRSGIDQLPNMPPQPIEGRVGRKSRKNRKKRKEFVEPGEYSTIYNQRNPDQSPRGPGSPLHPPSSSSSSSIDVMTAMQGIDLAVPAVVASPGLMGGALLPQPPIDLTDDGSFVAPIDLTGDEDVFGFPELRGWDGMARGRGASLVGGRVRGYSRGEHEMTTESHEDLLNRAFKPGADRSAMWGPGCESPPFFGTSPRITAASGNDAMPGYMSPL
ncbi:MAG: hypothetical protein M1823_003419 [Watsoniomyces obsoletus]|nr:MAG: hypothetical protein M1823_003419 [Watsoniomyces obsoletus]